MAEANFSAPELEDDLPARSSFGMPKIDREVLTAFIGEVSRDPGILERFARMMAGENPALTSLLFQQMDISPTLAKISDEKLREEVRGVMLRSNAFVAGAIAKQLNFDADLSELNAFTDAFGGDSDPSTPQSSDETVVD